MNASFVPVQRPSSDNLPARRILAYLRGLAYRTLEIATTKNPRMRTLGAQLLAMQAPTLAAMRKLLLLVFMIPLGLPLPSSGQILSPILFGPPPSSGGGVCTPASGYAALASRGAR
jgi:hypothetical protein